MVKKMLKKMFSRRNALPVIGGLLILSGVLIWVINFSFINVKTAKADADPGNSSDPGHFSEDWTAKEIFGAYVQGNGSNNDNISYGSSGDVAFWQTALGRLEGSSNGSLVYTYGSGAEKVGSATYGINQGSYHYRLTNITSKGAETPTVTKWHVDGHMHD